MGLDAAMGQTSITLQRRQREKDMQQAAILDAARELFMEAGEAAVTLRAVAERIGYSTTVIYQHFADKQALIQALCDRDFLHMSQTFARLSAIADAGARLHALGLAYVRFALEHPSAFRFMFLTARKAMSPKDSAIPKGNIALDGYAFLKHTLAECLAQGLLRPELDDVEQLAQLCWANVHGLACLYLFSDVHRLWIDWRPAMANAEALLEIFERGISRDGRSLASSTRTRKGR